MRPSYLPKQMNRLMFSCKEVTELVSASMDQDLPLHQRIKLKMHFLICALCARYRDQIRLLTTALRTHRERLEEQDGSSAAGLSPGARDRMKRALASPPE